MPISLMDLPKFGAVLSDRADFPRGPGAFGGALQEPREFQQRGGLADRDRPNFPPRGGGLRNSQMDDFLDPRMQPGMFPEDFEGGRMVGHNGPRADEPFPPRLGAREEFDRAEVRGRRPPVDEYERERFEYDMRRENFDPRMQDGFDPRGHNDRSDFDPRRREFFGPIEPVFGMPPMMGPKGPRGPVGPDGFGPRGARGPGPLMFHPRGMGPRGMRPGMRPPFAPRGPPFDPREADSFFRPPFDDMRGRPGPHLRPPFGPMGPPTMHGPDGPWRNQEGGGPSTSWSGQEGGPDVVHGQRENHLPRDKQKLTKQHQDYKNMSERENRNRNRKSRWGNVSPPLTDTDVEEVPPSEEAEGKMKAVLDRGEETKENFEQEVSSVIAADQPDHLRQQDESMVTQEQDVMHSNREGQLAGAQMADEHDAGEATGHSYGNDKVQEADSYELGADRFSSNDLALKQQHHEEERCEYGTLIPAEDSAQQSAVQVEQIGHVSENHSEQSVEQQADSL